MDDAITPPQPVPQAPAPLTPADIEAARRKLFAEGPTAEIQKQYPFLKAMHPGLDWQ